MKGFLIRGFNTNKDYPVNIYRSMLYIEGENLYLKTSNGTFHLSGNISSGGQINLDNYYTKLEMDSILDNIQIEGYITVEDLSEYVTNDKLIEEITKLNQVDFNIDEYLKIEDLDNNVTSIVDYSIAQLIDGAPEAFDTLREISDWIIADENKTFDLIEQVSLKADKSEIPSIEGLATETFVTEAINSINIPETDLTEYEKTIDVDSKLSLKADKSEIPSIDGLASETFVTEAISAIDLDNYVTTETMDSRIGEAIAQAQLEGNEVDLSVYEKSIDVDAKLSLKADKSEIPSIEGLATETFVTEAIGSIDFPETDLTEYEKSIDVDVKLSLKADKSEIPSIDGLATETFVTEAINSINIPETDLTEYEKTIDVDAKLLLKADKSEIPSIEGLASETFVTEAISTIDLDNYVTTETMDSRIGEAIAQAQLEGSEVDLTVYETTVDVDAKLSLKADKSEIPSIEGLATETFVTEAISAIEFPETDLTEYEKTIDVDDKLLLKADKSEIPSIDGLATETFVTEAIGAIDFPETDLTEYEKSIDVDDKLLLKADKSEIPSIEGLATETFVTEAIGAIDFPETDLTAYETKVDNDVKLSLKADKTEIPSIEGLATETFVTEAIGAIDFPVTDLTEYEKTIDVDDKLSLKADKTYVDNKFNDKVDKVINKGLSTEDYTTEDKEKLRNIENIIDIKVNSSIGNLVDGAPETFDTLREIADWIENDGVTATELSTSISNKVDINVFEQSVSDERTLSNEIYVSKTSQQITELYKGGEMISTSPKIWVGKVETTSAGVWSVDYSDAGFTVPPNVTATAYCRNNGSANGDAAYASIIEQSITTTGCGGRLSSATSAGLLAAMVSTSAEGSISIIAIGI